LRGGQFAVAGTIAVTPVEVIHGAGPVILGQPHGGTFVPDDIAARLNKTGLALADTDWHIARLYDGLCADTTVVRANFHRYVIDANRDPAGFSLYPGQNTTGLCPVTDFDGQAIYRPGAGPDEREISARLEQWHAPYHRALAVEIERVMGLHGVAVLYDCHSIRSVVPYLFEGRLPDLNIGTNNGATCDARIEAETHRISAASQFPTVLNGRFRGGWTTRHYGRPEAGVHAIQMEIAQSAYLAAETPPWAYDETKANELRRPLGGILAAIAEIALEIKEERDI
jgi:N-formylglutamate deformylase